MGLHRQSTKNHKLENWTYADAAARLAATGLLSEDLGKIAYQTDDGTYWRLTATTPTWVSIETNAQGPIEAYTYADAATREAATGFVVGDVGKISYQTDDGTYWRLTDDSPTTWAAIGGSGLPPGGTIGQVLAKLSGTDGDADWADPSGGGGAALLASAFADVSTTSTDGTQDTLLTTSIPANTLTANGDMIRARYSLKVIGSATSGKDFRADFNSSAVIQTDLIGDSMFVAGTKYMEIELTFVRVSNTVVRCLARMCLPPETTINSVLSPTYILNTEKTGLNLTTTAYNLVVKAGSYGTGAAAADVVLKLAYVEYVPAP